MKSTRYKIVFNRLRSRTKNYFNETTLHGFRYIADPKSSKFKSYFWTIVCLISTCLCFILIRSQFRSYYSNRITTTILTTAFPIWEVPFPAVTICNFNIVYKESTKPFRELLEKHDVTAHAMDGFFSNLSALVLSNKVEREVKWSAYHQITRLLEHGGFNTAELMAALVHPCDVMITDCYWNSKEMNCTDIFRLIKTNSGFCCSFNYRGHETDEEELYVSGVGPAFGLYVHLHVEEDEYISPLKHSSGIDISVHENIQYPDMSIYGTTIRPGNDVSLSVKPEITQSEDDVRQTEINTRGCALADEIEMEWTTSYSYTTCINKCKAKTIQKLCRCIPFYYYPVQGRPKYCTLADMACVTKYNAKLKTSKITFSGIKTSHNYKYSSASDDALACKCYPQCNEISYSYQQDQQPIKIMESEESRANHSILRVYLGHVSCTKLLRSVLITWELILASVGGLIGLCLGGSILSIIEFLYHIMETLFSRYAPKKKAAMKVKPKYEPKLYLTDFGHVPNEILIHVASSKSISNNKKLKLSNKH